MPEISTDLLTGGVTRLTRELLLGPSPRGSWILNAGDPGVLATLDGIGDADASRVLIPGRSTIAGHANHLLYSLELLNRWTAGENPYADADWEGSWRVQEVSGEEWAALRTALRHEANAWLDAIPTEREWDGPSVTGVMASAAHLAYHVGAVRQLIGHLSSGGR